MLSVLRVATLPGAPSTLRGIPESSVLVYNASNNELVQTNTPVKSAIIQIDATLFRQWYKAHVHFCITLAQPVTNKGTAQAPAADATESVKLSNHAQRSLDEKKNEPKLTLSWNPRRADGYVLDSKELEYNTSLALYDVHDPPSNSFTVGCLQYDTSLALYDVYDPPSNSYIYVS
ncbi:hypothetical protein C8R44DRAFT_890657 [Mycena epipterygia]|nr:hypothetical protein C8R44DRAFT_890657 [Mycena epipterygia]